MTKRAVQAVFFWPADMATPFRAVYGRVRSSTRYSKDFHQVAEPAAKAMERAFGLERRGQTSLTWAWPGGDRTENSQFKPGAENDSRSRAHWPYGESPDPWRLAPEVSSETLQCITGNPGQPGATLDSSDEAIAEGQLEAVQEAGERPWYIAVHLLGDGPVLHARAVLENPTPEHDFASWENLPERVRKEMSATRKSGDATGFVEFEENQLMPLGQLVREILEAFEDNPNVLLVGPPGTGKTIAMEAIREVYQGKPTDTVMFDTAKGYGAFETVSVDFEGEQAVRSLVFHPSYAYEHFVIGLLPDLIKDSDQVTVRPHVGPLLELAHFASEPNRRALLILDEFNRASASAVFGDTLALLDAEKRSEPGDAESGTRFDTVRAPIPKDTGWRGTRQ